MPPSRSIKQPLTSSDDEHISYIQSWTTTTASIHISLNLYQLHHNGEILCQSHHSENELTFQSAPKVIIDLLITGIRIFGKATSAAGTQAVRSKLNSHLSLTSRADAQISSINQTEHLHLDLSELDPQNHKSRIRCK
jgi:hypothetical protein